MRINTFGKLGITAVAATATLGLSMGTAWATHQYVVSGGPSYTAESDGSIDFVVYDQNGNQTVAMGCAAVEAEGDVNVGTTARPGALASIDSTTWLNCTGPGNLNMAVTQDSVWDIVGTGAATAGNSDVIAGYVDGVEATVEDTDLGGAACSFTVSGTADGSFDEGAQQLNIDETAGNLVIDSVSAPCLGVVDVGYTADFIGTFDVDAGSPILVDSPAH